MTISYTPQTWADNDASKPLSAARMTHLEAGIAAVVDAFNNGVDPTAAAQAVVDALNLGDAATHAAADFASPASVSTAVSGEATARDAAISSAVTTEATARTAGDAAAVHLAGAETITGAKTFSVPPTMPTPTASGHAATKAYADGLITALVNAAPTALDTLNELAAALGGDANFSTTVLNALAGKVPTTRLVAGKPLSADVTLVKGDVGLGSVDNTADTAKPVSTAQAVADAAVQSAAAIDATNKVAALAATPPATSDLSSSMVDEWPLTPAPTVTFTGSATSSYTTPTAVPAVAAGVLNPLLRVNVNDYTVSGSFIVPNQVAATVGATPAGDQSQALQVEFDCDDASFEIDANFTSTTGSLLRVWANEQESATFGPAVATGRQLVKVNFGTRAYRRIVIELDSQINFYGIKTSTTGTITAASNHNATKLAVIGDSYLHGDGYNAGGASLRSYFTTMARALGYSRYRRWAASGTGIVNAGAFGTYQARVAAVAAYAPDVVIVQGSQNDNGQGGVQAAATTLIQALQAALPKATIILTGVLRSYAVQAADVTTNTALAAAATATGVPFVDASAWFTGTGQVTSPNASGNSDFYNAQYQSGHPSPAGHIFLGKQMARAVSFILNRHSAQSSEPGAAAVLALLGRADLMSPISSGGEFTMGRRTVNRNNVALTSGVILFGPAVVATKTETIGNVSTGTGNAAAGTTFAAYGVYEVDDAGNLTLVASSASDVNLWASSFQTLAPSGTVNVKKGLTASFVKIAGKRYTVGNLWIGTTTAPNIYGADQLALDAVTALVPPFVGAKSTTGQTGFPATIAVGTLTGVQTQVPANSLLP